MLFSKLFVYSALLLPAALALVVPEGSASTSNGLVAKREETPSSPAAVAPNSIKESDQFYPPYYPPWRPPYFPPWCRYRPWRCGGGGWGGGWGGGGGGYPRRPYDHNEPSKRDYEDANANEQLEKRNPGGDTLDYQDYEVWKREQQDLVERDRFFEE
ncbi:hypothetical protein JCM3765_004952 [Sporobolomyces pararoseus]